MRIRIRNTVYQYQELQDQTAQVTDFPKGSNGYQRIFPVLQKSWPDLTILTTDFSVTGNGDKIRYLYSLVLRLPVLITETA